MQFFRVVSAIGKKLHQEKECFANTEPKPVLFLNWSNDWHKKILRNFLFSLKISISLSTTPDCTL